jgi:hypothetical protein
MNHLQFTRDAGDSPAFFFPRTPPCSTIQLPSPSSLGVVFINRPELLSSPRRDSSASLTRTIAGIRPNGVKHSLGTAIAQPYPVRVAKRITAM